MKKIFLSLLSILFMSLSSLAQSDSINWKNPHHGSVNTIVEKIKSTLEKDMIIDANDFTEADFLAFEETLVLSDSIVIRFNENEQVIVSQSFCFGIKGDKNMIPCLTFNQIYDENNNWLNSNVINSIENDTIIYTDLSKSKEGLPTQLEGRNTKGELLELNYYELNEKGFIKKIRIDNIIGNSRLEIAKEYDNGYTLSDYSFKYFTSTDDKYELRIEESTTYIYLAFDKYGNWTKRRNIENNGEVSYTYRTYIYNE